MSATRKRTHTLSDDHSVLSGVVVVMIGETIDRVVAMLGIFLSLSLSHKHSRSHSHSQSLIQSVCDQSAAQAVFSAVDSALSAQPVLTA